MFLSLLGEKGCLLLGSLLSPTLLMGTLQADFQESLHKHFEKKKVLIAERDVSFTVVPRRMN